MYWFFALIVILIVFAFGSSIGSFLNVIVYRVPAGLSILWPASRCPKCLHQLATNDNIPVFGWFLLKGKCRYCHVPIPKRYFLVELATGLLFLLVFAQFGVNWQTWQYWAFFSWLIALSLIDIDTMTLPNPLTQTGLIAGLAFHVGQGLWPVVDVNLMINHLIGGMGGAVLGLWLFDLIGLIGAIALGKTAMGGGDAKLLAMIGAWLGWKYMLLAGFIACCLGAFSGGLAIALGWLKRGEVMPFGPFLAMGAMISGMWGDRILNIYLSLFFPSNI